MGLSLDTPHQDDQKTAALLREMNALALTTTMKLEDGGPFNAMRRATSEQVEVKGAPGLQLSEDVQALPALPDDVQKLIEKAKKTFQELENMSVPSQKEVNIHHLREILKLWGQLSEEDLRQLIAWSKADWRDLKRRNLFGRVEDVLKSFNSLHTELTQILNRFLIKLWAMEKEFRQSKLNFLYEDEREEILPFASEIKVFFDNHPHFVKSTLEIDRQLFDRAYENCGHRSAEAYRWASSLEAAVRDLDAAHHALDPENELTFHQFRRAWKILERLLSEEDKRIARIMAGKKIGLSVLTQRSIEVASFPQNFYPDFEAEIKLIEGLLSGYEQELAPILQLLQGAESEQMLGTLGEALQLVNRASFFQILPSGDENSLQDLNFDIQLAERIAGAGHISSPEALSGTRSLARLVDLQAHFPDQKNIQALARKFIGIVDRLL